MKSYIEITLLPDTQGELYFLWEKVYALLHLRLVELKNEEGNSSIGFSFPDYKSKSLGQKLRLFAQDKAQLEQFNTHECLKNLQDYVHIKSIQAAPEKITTYASYSRVQVKSNAMRLMRRSVKNGKKSLQEAEEKLKMLSNKETTLPYIQLKSQSNGEQFKLFIHSVKREKQHNEGFNCYGLSKKSSVPVF